ncbi:MAG: pseudouridine synthase [Pyramidobacter sp.]|nr:pseudouridine synthase [Pyramidobacter sp.]
MRLNKYLALCGVGSRRSVEQFIFEGRVVCGGYQVTEPGYDVPDGEVVTVDDVEVRPEKKIYMVIHKPRGYICAVTDRNYPVVLDLLPREYDYYRLFPVGRLDLQSEGLLMLTNDGDFAQEMIHPRAGITKEYEVRLDREPTDSELKQLRRGTVFEGKRLRPAEVGFIARAPYNRWLRFVLNEGIKREIRIIAESAGLTVQVLFRRKIGRMELRKLKSGCSREYSADQLRSMIQRGGIV